MAKVREVDANLMLAAGAGFDTEQRKTHLTPALSPHPTGGEGELLTITLCNRTIKSSLDPKFRLRKRAVGAHAIFDGDGAGLILAQ